MRKVAGVLLLMGALAASLGAQAPKGSSNLAPVSFNRFCQMTAGGVEPYIADYFKRYPEQKGCEPVIRRFFADHPPDVMMPYLQERAPKFYSSIKAQAEASAEGKKVEAYSLDDFLKLPEAEHRELAKLAGPALYALVTEEASKAAIQQMVKKENRAAEVAFLLVQMRAQQSTPEVFTSDLAQMIAGLAQIRQAAEGDK